MSYTPLIVGLVLIIVAVISIILKSKIAMQLQSFRGLGVVLRISFATLLIVVGTTCTLANIILAYLAQQESNAKDKEKYEKTYQDLVSKAEEYQKLINDLTNPTIKVYLQLDTAIIYTLNPKKLSVSYLRDGELDPKTAPVHAYADRFNFDISKITKSTLISDVKLYDSISRRAWIFDPKKFNPSIPLMIHMKE